MTVEEFLNRLDRMSNQCRDATHFTSKEPDMTYYSGMAKAFDIVYKDLSKVEFEERPKGKWLPKGRWHIDPQCIEYTCSICGRRIMREERLNVIEQYPFCHCGADMRGTYEV